VLCGGPLPAICEMCANGIAACAHWVEDDGGGCRIEICP
jgi:hypothetical protein